MLEGMVKKYVYSMDFIDLNILEAIIMDDGMIAFPTLVKRLKKINVWDRGTIRRRVEQLKRDKLIYFEENNFPLIIEAYKDDVKDIIVIRDLLKVRLIRY